MRLALGIFVGMVIGVAIGWYCGHDWTIRGKEQADYIFLVFMSGTLGGIIEQLIEIRQL
jgi:hypothetical protein